MLLFLGFGLLSRPHINLCAINIKIGKWKTDEGTETQARFKHFKQRHLSSSPSLSLRVKSNGIITESQVVITNSHMSRSPAVS